MSRPLNNYIRTHRKRLGLSQDELAHLLGVEEGATVSRYESGRLPSLETALALSRVFGVSVESLFFGEVLRVVGAADLRVAFRAQRGVGNRRRVVRCEGGPHVPAGGGARRGRDRALRGPCPGERAEGPCRGLRPGDHPTRRRCEPGARPREARGPSARGHPGSATVLRGRARPLLPNTPPLRGPNQKEEPRPHRRPLSRPTPAQEVPAPALQALLDPGALSTPIAAEYLGLSPATLETLRCRGGGPVFVKLGRRVVYRREDLEAWMERERRASTSAGDAPRIRPT